MSLGENTDRTTSPPNPRKRKRNIGGEDIIIDPSLPEPVSRKVQRKQKKSQNTQQSEKQGPHSQNQHALQSGLIAKNDTSQDRSEYGVWIGNLPWNASKSTLKEFITAKTGLDESVFTRMHMPVPRKDQASKGAVMNNKGFAYVDLKDESILEAVLLLNESLMGGRALLIKKAKDFQGRPEKADRQHKQSREILSKSSRPKSKRIFVGNLGFDVTKEELSTHFQACGEITDLHMATFEDTGKCKGYAWITFSYQEAAESAIRGYIDLQSVGKEKGANTMGARGKNDKKGKFAINKMQGRLLRCEFAEEAKIRYQRRYGKG